jgi:hypothetical protein
VETLVDFIAAFGASGPGRHKLIRLRKEMLNVTRANPYMDDRHREAGPIVRVSSLDTSSAAGTTEDLLASEEKRSLINARSVLNQAYRALWESR